MATTNTATANQTILINGRAMRVLNTLRCGPDAPVHTFELEGGAYIYEAASRWWLQEPGRLRRFVDVAF